MKLDLKNILTENSIEPQGLIHVGAYDGKDLKTYQDLGISKVLLIEANPRICERITDNIIEWGIKLDTQTFNYAVSDYDGEGELFIYSLEKSSSLFPLQYYREIYPNVKEIKKINVTVRTLDNLLAEFSIDTSEFNILNIDVPRPELVLAGAKKLLPNIDVILTQVNYEPLYQDSLLIENFEQLLQQNGFIQKGVISPYHPAWGEAVYLSINAINPDDPVLASVPSDILKQSTSTANTNEISYIDAYKQAELEQLQSRLNIYLALASELKTELEQEKNNSQTLQAQLEQERSQYESTQVELNWLKTELEQTQCRLKIYLDVSQELKAELEIANSDKQNLNQSISASDQTLETLELTQLQLSQVQAELELTRSQLEQAQQELITTKEQLKLSPTQGIPANYHAHLKALAKIIAETLPES